MAKVFTGIKGFISRHKKLTIFLVIVLVLAVIVVSCVSSVNKALEGLQSAAPDVTVLTPTSLEKVVSATGILESTQVRQVTTTQTAEVQEIYVSAGDKVKAGDVLCVLDSTSLDKEIDYIRASLGDAEVSDAIARRQANRQVQDANENYEYDKGQIDKDVNAAKTALDDILAMAENDAQHQSGLSSRIAERDAAYQAYLDAQAQYGDVSEITSACWQQYDAAYKAAEAAQLQYDLVYAGYAESISLAQQAYDGAVSSRDSVLRQDEQSLRTARDNAETRAATNSTRSLQNQLDTLLDQKEEMTIYAPISGTVTAVNAEVGVSAAGMSASVTTGVSSGLFEIQDVESMQVPSTVAEYDMVDIENGMEVEITSDALTGESWTGIVTSISPVAVDTAGNFEVLVVVTSEAGNLTPGMSARMNIIVERKANTYSVPFDAVVTNEDGQQVVYVYEGGAAADSSADAAALAASTRQIVVQTGLETDYYVEILSPDLADGMQVLNDPLGVNANAAFDMNISIG